jgi:hypothetical protein
MNLRDVATFKDAWSSYDGPPSMTTRAQPNEPKLAKSKFSHRFVIVDVIDS